MRYKVLIVEDEEVIRKGLSFVMNWEKVGCAVVGEAADGEEGLEKIRTRKPDIVICDIRMPVMDGLEMLQKSTEYNYEAILLSGYSEFPYAQKAISLGVREYLLKPVDFKKLEACIIKITNLLKEKQNKEHERLKALAARPEILKSEWMLPGDGVDRHVKEMLEYVRNQYDKRISLTHLAQKMEISPSYLNTKFKLTTGYTFNDFLNRFRITKAVELMQQPECRLKVYEIAEIVGFSDYKYFNKVFKKYTSYPPQRLLQEGFGSGEA